MAWGRSFYRHFKYKKEIAPEPTKLEALVDTISQMNHEVNLDVLTQNIENEIITKGATEDITNGEGDKKLKIDLQEKLNIDMPFYSQAPFANWGMPYQEACEEASTLLVANVYQKKNWTKKQFDKEILKIVDWEVKKFGSYEHTTVSQTAVMIQEYFGLNTEIHGDPSFEEVQEILSSGHLIVAPFAGKDLGNPNFTNGGPKYHMLVIKGFDAKKQPTFILGKESKNLCMTGMMEIFIKVLKNL